MTILPQAIYRFNAIPYQNTNAIFHRTKINNSKMFMEPQKTWITKTILRKKNKAGDITLPDFKLYYTTTKRYVFKWYDFKKVCY